METETQQIPPPLTERAQRRSAAGGFNMWTVLLHVQLGKDTVGFLIVLDELDVLAGPQLQRAV